MQIPGKNTKKAKETPRQEPHQAYLLRPFIISFYMCLLISTPAVLFAE